MALITGSTIIDWSTVSLDLANYQTQYDALSGRLESVLTDLETGQFMWNSRPTSTFGSVTLTSIANAGAIVNMGGSGFGSPSALVTSVSYRNPSTSDFFKVRGSFDGAGNEVLTGFTFGTSGLEAGFAGRIVADASGNFVSGTVNMLQLTVGTTAVSINGSLIIDANFDFVGGTVTRIAVVSDSNTILMTGLSLPYSVLDPLTTSADLCTLIGSQLSGNDTIFYTNNSGTGMSFSVGAGNDIITINGPNGDTLDGGAGNDILTGRAGDDTLLGGDGNDVFVIANATDHGAGEVITGGAGDDTIRFTSTTPGQTLVLAPGVTEVEGVTIGTAAGVTTGTTGLNVDASAVGSGLVITGNAGANVLTGTVFDDVLMGNPGNDELEGEEGNDALVGGLGHDWLAGGVGDDTLDGGGSCDYMIGGDGNDTYVVDDIDDSVIEQPGGGTDTVKSNRSVDLNLSSFASIENVLLTGTAALNATGNGVDNLLTGNGAANILIGGAGNDTLSGGAGNDTFVGGEGDDQLEGEEGNDTYRYEEKVTILPDPLGGPPTVVGGWGIDSISESGGNDLVIMKGSDLSGTIFSQQGTDLEIEGASGSIIIQNQYAVGGASKVESLQFTGGTSIYGYVLGNTPYLLNTDSSQTGGLKNDLIAGTTAGETLNGNAGNDLLFGIAGNDILNGGAGNDLLVGNNGFSVTQIDGGDGNDTIFGGTGSVTGGAGDDRIVMDIGNVGPIDAGTGNDTLLPVSMLGIPGDVVIDLSQTGDQLLSINGVQDSPIQGNFENVDASGLINPFPGLPPIPGSTNSVTVTGSDAANILIGSVGNDTLNGGAGNDTIAGGAGDDQLDGGEGNDTYRYDAGPILFPLHKWDSGNDSISDSGGNDLLIMNGLNLGGAIFLHEGNNLLIQGLGSGITIEEQYTGDKVESLQFTGGASMYGYVLGSTPYLLNTDLNHNGSLQNDIIAGTSIGETLNGNAGNDLLFGNGGDDILNGGAGNDLLVANGNGSTQINGGNGDDRIVVEVDTAPVSATPITIDGGTGSDTLVLMGVIVGTVVDLSNQNDQLQTEAGTLDPRKEIHFENLDASGAAIIVLPGTDLTVTGSDGANIIVGSIGNDMINAGAGNDRLDGGAGDDVMDGEAGNDTYVVDSSSDIAAESLAGVAGGVDLVQSSAPSFTLGANVENLTLLGTRDINGTGNSLNNILTGNSGNNDLDGGVGADKMAGGLGNDIYRVDAIGDVVTEALNAGTDNVISTVTYTLGANVENLQLISGANINGTGNTLANVLTGSNGDNLLSGLGGNDTLRGLHGNDTLNGGVGNDTYLFDLGDGMDVIQDNNGCFDKISFDSGINHQDLVISQQANDLRIAIHGSADQITVKNWFVGTANQTEIIQTGDGQVLLNTQVDQLIQAMAGFTQQTGLTWDQGIDQRPQDVQAVLAGSWQ